MSKTESNPGRIYKSIVILMIWIICTQAIPLFSQPQSNEVFEHLNLDYPGLEDVKKAYQEGNLSEALSELLKYFNNRTNRELLESNKNYPYDSLKVAQNIINRFQLKGSYYDFGDRIDWTKEHADMHWQLTLCRMGWFDDYIGIYQITKDEKYVRAWMNQIDGWLELDNPGHPRTIDTGRRMEYWVKSHWMLVTKLKSPTVTPEFNAQMLTSMAEQAAFLYNPDNWRRYSNWGSFENSGFSKFVIMYPEFKRNKMWLREIYFRMRSQLSESFYDEGMHIEVSPSYHGHELEVWLNFLKLSKLNKVKNPWHTQIPLPPLSNLFIAPARALMHYYKPTGFMPQVGDTDLRDERELLSELAQFWKLPDLQYVATDGQKGEPPTETSIAFPEVGYFFMRSGWGNQTLPFDNEFYLLFDCGSNYPWHGHFDMLNLVATAYGHDLLKDPGRFTYNEGDERDYFKSTAAHNTIVIDNLDQPKKYTPSPAQWVSSSSYDYVSGFYNYDSNITHTRSVFFIKSEYWIITDRISGKGKHQFDQYYHLSEEAQDHVKLINKGSSIEAPNFQLHLLGDDLNVTLEQNYLSYTYREKVTAPVVRRSARRKPPIIWPTILYPFDSEAPDLIVEAIKVSRTKRSKDSTDPIAFSISSSDGVDIFFEQEHPGEVWEFAKMRTDAKAAFIRLDTRGEIISYSVVQGTGFTYQDQEIVQICGDRANISWTLDRVELAGERLTGFEFSTYGDPDVFLNGEFLKTKKSKAKISYNFCE